jgi:hypothetical protein
MSRSASDSGVEEAELSHAISILRRHCSRTGCRDQKEDEQGPDLSTGSALFRHWNAGSCECRKAASQFPQSHVSCYRYAAADQAISVRVRVRRTKVRAGCASFGSSPSWLCRSGGPADGECRGVLWVERMLAAMPARAILLVLTIPQIWSPSPDRRQAGGGSISDCRVA